LQANKKRRPVDFGTGDLVYVSKKEIKTESPNTKLDLQYTGPWKIVKKRGYSFVFDIPI